MNNEAKRAIVVTTPSTLTVASRLAQRTLVAREQRTALAEVGSSPSGLALTGVRTLVVDASDSSAYRTISAAVAVAADGDRIVVRPGTYRESVAVVQSVEIVGDGEIDAIVIASDDAPAFVLDRTAARIIRMTIEGGTTVGRTVEPAVLVTGGSPLLEELTLAERMIQVQGGASPTIRKCRIRGGGGIGVFMHEGARGTVESNDVLGSSFAGILLRGEGTAPLVHGNTIHDCLTGVMVSDGATPTIEGNDVFGCKTWAIDILRAGPASLVRNNSIHDNHGHGIALGWKSAGTVEGNEIFSNARCGITVGREKGAPLAESGTPLIRANRVYRNLGAGIAVMGGTAAIIRTNEIYGNEKAGIEVFGAGAAPFIESNTISDNKSYGIIVGGGAAGTITYNKIVGNRRKAIAVDGGASPHVEANTVR